MIVLLNLNLSFHLSSATTNETTKGFVMAFNEWFSASELAGLPGMPGDKSSVNRRANKEGWKKRQRAGVRGRLLSSTSHLFLCN